ncbi:MAG: ImmA/IrrE family metallo-endopeptidase [Steroidobacteraceae bacterium]
MIDSNIERKADRLLEEARLKHPPVNVEKLAKVIGVSVRLGPMPDELSGFLLHTEDGPIIGINSLHSKTRQAFTFAHECGHFLLHPKANFVDRGFYFRDARSAQATDPREIEANQFAAALLMPARFIDSVLRNRSVDIEDERTVKEFAKIFGVSAQAFTFRLINLGLAEKG